MTHERRDLSDRPTSSDLFRGSQQYYARYRPGIPDEVVTVIVDHFGLERTDRILDLGCGTGQVTLAFDGRGAEIVGIDANREMIRLAKRAATRSSSRCTWIVSGTDQLKSLRSEIGTFKLATISRAFHWMNQEQVLNDLDAHIDDDGGLAIFSDGSLWTGQEDWQKAVKAVVQDYLGAERRAASANYYEPTESWKLRIARSPFRALTVRQVCIERLWDIESVVGCLLSSSFARPVFFGERLESFKHDAEAALRRLSPAGEFSERAVFSIVLASRN